MSDAGIEMEQLVKSWHKTDDVVMLKLLLKEGVDVNVKDQQGYSKLRRVNHADNLRFLLSVPGIDIDSTDNEGKSLLFSLLTQESTKIIVEAGANINLQDKDGNTPIMLCTNEGKIKYLVSKGADLTIKNNKGETVFDIMPKRYHEFLKSDIDIAKDFIDTLDDNGKGFILSYLAKSIKNKDSIRAATTILLDNLI